MLKRVLFFLLLSCTLQAASIAQTGTINKINTATVNTLLIFTSQEGLNSGLYHFTKTEIEIDMEVYHLPFTYHFKSDSNVNYFIVGNVGYSRVFLNVAIQDLPDNTILNYLNHIQTYTAGLGGGARYRIRDKLHISGGFELIYSRAGASVAQPEGDIGDKIEDFFNFNYSDNISYKFFTLMEYRPIIYEYKPYLTLGYKLYETKTSFTFSQLASFKSASSVTSFALGTESPKIFSIDRNNFTLETYIHGHYLTGTVKDVINFNTYGNIGGVAYWNTPEKKWGSSRYFLEVNKVYSDGLRGYNVGIGFTLDF